MFATLARDISKILNLYILTMRKMNLAQKEKAVASLDLHNFFAFVDDLALVVFDL